MKECAKLFTGMKDFSSFSEPDKEDKLPMVFVEDLTVTEENDLIIIRIKASHFLWKMVRRITGTLVEAGRGNVTAEKVDSFFNVYSNEPAKLTAPPSGLFLEKIFYK